MKKKSVKSKVVAGLVIVCAVIGGIFTISHIKIIGTGKVGITYTYARGVKDELLKPGAHFIPPMEYMKEFSTSNEILVLSKDKREGSEGDDSFKVATSDDASIAISFQMTYRYIEDQVIDTYKKFKGMDGEDIVENRVKTVLKSKISEITTDYSMMDIYSGNRTKLNEAITDYLNKDFSKKYGIEVLDASIIDVHQDKKLKISIDKAEADANIEITKAKADAEKTRIASESQAKANKELSASITDKLIRMKEAEAHYKNGWVTVQGAGNTVVDATEK